MPAALSDAEIERRLKNLKGWRHEGAFITKTFRFSEFMQGVEFIDAVARIAEEEEHHPDISVRYTTIKLSVQTHSEGGVTEWDFGLAEKIEARLAKRSPGRIAER